jgi:radical SAM superfamily enzyme YgiQ (UPF0313 family)
MGSIETKRGCGEKCIYCPEPLVKGRKCRMRQPEYVVDEIQSLLQSGVAHFHTCDSEFNLPIEHAKMVCREIIKRGLGDKIQWYVYASPTPFSEELMRLMKRKRRYPEESRQKAQEERREGIGGAMSQL